MNNLQCVIVCKPIRFLSYRFLFFILLFSFSIPTVLGQVSHHQHPNIEKAKQAIENGDYLKAYLYAIQAKPTITTEGSLEQLFVASAEYLNIIELFTNRIEDGTGKQFFYGLEFESYELMIDVCE